MKPGAGGRDRGSFDAMRSIVVALVLFAGCSSSDVSREIGARCDSARECDDRCLPPSGDFPDGLCTRDCQSSGECPDDTDCIDKDNGVCLFTCSFDQDCSFLGMGWECRELNVRGTAAGKVKACIGK